MPPAGDLTAERGGVLLRVDAADGEGALGFVPAEVARRLTALSSLTPVPGARLPVVGIALADGAVVTVLRIGPGGHGGGDPRPGPRAPRTSYAPGDDWIVPGADRAILCQLGGIEVALTGATVVATGVFDRAPGDDGVLWRSEVVPILDVRALYAQAETASWTRRGVSLGETPRPPARSAPPSAWAGDDGRSAGAGDEGGNGS